MGVGNEWVSRARRMIPADTPSPCHSSPIFIGLPRYFFSSPVSREKRSQNRESPQPTALTERGRRVVYFNSQSTEVIELPVLSWVPFSDLLNGWKTRPNQNFSSWGLPSLPPAILLPPKDFNLLHPYPWKALRELQ